MANGKFVCAEGEGNQPLIANREVPRRWETFEEMRLVNGVPTSIDDDEPVHPPDPPQPKPVDPTIPPQVQFMAWVSGKPFGQQTLLDLEPTLTANGWLLTPPNAASERTKIKPPNSKWVRVGFGEGSWVWKMQNE